MKNISINHLVFLLFLIGISVSAKGQENQIEKFLSELPDVHFRMIDSPDGYTAAYELRVNQLIDHSDSAKGYFSQRVLLSHKSFERPMVMITEGYAGSRNRINELTNLIDGNQLIIEHRYFGESLPDTIDYSYLNIAQLTADLHHINTLFKQIYEGKWLSTGRSKGGATTLFYRYLYPDDVDVSVNYVGPINTSFEDERIYHFLDTVGTPECRSKIKSFQEYLLRDRDKMIPIITKYILAQNASFTYFTIEMAFELAVMEYPFSFWQYGHNCTEIPTSAISDSAAVAYFLSISDILFFSDEAITRLAPHYYQSANEMGYYGYETSAFKGYLKELSPDSNPHAAFTPNKMKVPFNDTYLKEINAWLPEHGNKIIHIYGNLDTWSASAVPPSDKVDAVWFFMNGKHHGNALIENMNPFERKELISTLEKWLDMVIED